MDKILNALIMKLAYEKKYYRNNMNITEMISKDHLRLSKPGNEYEQLKSDLMKCKKCDLYKTVRNKVIGYGNRDARIMLIGEAPGANEDREGKPFIGRAGEKLTQMLGYIGLKRDDVYITNVVKCRPPQNADPQKEWIIACNEFLDREIEIVKPEYILTLGRFASRIILNMELTMGQFSGNHYKLKNGIIVVPTYHPSSLLIQKGERKEITRKKVANDLKLLKSLMGENNG